MNQLDELFEEITESRNEVVLEREKEMVEEIQDHYQEAGLVISSLLTQLGDKYGDEQGVLSQNELMKHNRLEKIKLEIAKNLNEVYKTEKKMMDTSLNKWIEEEYYYQMFLLSQVDPEFVLGELDDKQVKAIMKENWAGETYEETLKRKKMDLTLQIGNDLLRTSMTGLSIKQANDIIGKRIGSGLKHSELVYTNELSRKKTKAGDEVVKKLKKEPNYQWVATLDERTCKICGSMDGKRGSKDSFPVLIPAHPRCRCRLITVIDGWKQTSRAARDLNTYKTYLTNEENYKDWAISNGLGKKLGITKISSGKLTPKPMIPITKDGKPQFLYNYPSDVLNSMSKKEIQDHFIELNTEFRKRGYEPIALGNKPINTDFIEGIISISKILFK